MRNFFRNFKVLAVVLLLVLTIGLLVACNSSPAKTNKLVSGESDIQQQPINDINDIVENVTYFDESQVVNTSKDYKFEVSSNLVLTNENIGTYLTVTNRNGEVEQISVEETGCSLYEISKSNGYYVEGETYLITIGDEYKGEILFLGHEDQSTLSFTIDKKKTAICVEKDGIVKLSEGAGFEMQGQNVFATGDNTIGADSILEVTYADGSKEYKKVVSNEIVNNRNVLYVSVPTISEIYEKLDVYSNEQFDCSQLDIAGIDKDSVIQKISETDMYGNFVESIGSLNEAMPALSIPKLGDFDIDFKAKVNEDKNIVIDVIISYKGEVAEGEKPEGNSFSKLYVELKYQGVISYDIKASVKAGIDFDYDFSVTANTTHKISLAVQWLDANDDVIIKNDEALANEINAIMADKSNIPSKVLENSKEIGKGFSVPLGKTFTYVIPKTPITVNLDFEWILDLRVQGEIFTDIEMTSSDTMGVRSVEKDGKDDQEFYHVKSKDANNDTMLFGGAVVKTGVKVNAYFSIVGMQKNIRVGISGKAGVYIAIKGITAKSNLTDEKIGVLYGEVGLFAGFEIKGKVFVQFNIYSKEFSKKLFDFGTKVIYTDFVEAEVVLDTTKTVTLNGTIDKIQENGLNNLAINKFVVKDFGIETLPLSRDKFDFSIENGYLTYFGNQFYITTPKHQFVEKITVSLKEDPEIKKVITVNYDDGYRAPVVEPDPVEPPVEPGVGTTEPEIPVEPETPVTPDVPEAPVEPETPVEPEVPAEPEIVNMIGSLILYDGNDKIKEIETQYSVNYPVVNLYDKLGYTFEGWFYENGAKATIDDKNGNAIYTMPINTSQSINVYAKWAKTFTDYNYVSVPADIKSIDANGNYFFLNDIDLAEVNWTPVKEFNGNIKGNGFTISHFTLDGDDGFGGFVGINKGTIENLKIKANVNYTSTKEDVYFGIIAGQNKGIIKNCETRGKINITMKGNGFFVKEYDGFVGGVVGQNDGKIYNSKTFADVYVETNNVKINPYAGGFVGLNNGTISNANALSLVKSEITNGASTCISYAGGFVAANRGSIYSSSSWAYGNTEAEIVGGFAGLNDGRILKSYSKGNLNGEKNVGGFVGLNNNTISNCYSTVNVGGKEKVGGLVGTNEGTISNCYASGYVIAEKSVGGLVGVNEKGASIKRCYACGDVKSTKNTWLVKDWAGGLVGEMNKKSSVENCYRSANQKLDIADKECMAGISVTSSVTNQVSFYNQALGFSIYTWNISNTLPTLK